MKQSVLRMLTVQNVENHLTLENIDCVILNSVLDRRGPVLKQKQNMQWPFRKSAIGEESTRTLYNQSDQPGPILLLVMTQVCVLHYTSEMRTPL